MTGSFKRALLRPGLEAFGHKKAQYLSREKLKTSQILEDVYGFYWNFHCDLA